MATNQDTNRRSLYDIIKNELNIVFIDSTSSFSNIPFVIKYLFVKKDIKLAIIL